jgi:hypothetical protein
MYVYNESTNELVEVEMTTFASNKLKEREHIEEWIRKNPSIIDENLLIIAHEYDKFSTDERLDLLAIDSDGSLVVIELKRDNTGSSVDFQSLKYCSYCSQLSPQEIVDIFDEYLHKNNIQGNAIDLIADHLGLNSENEDQINELINNTQKFIIIGKEIDKRILSVCAWLTDNGIDCRCLTIKPYKKDNTILIDVDQIIPPFKIGDYYLGSKEIKYDKNKVYQSSEVIEFFDFIGEQFARRNIKKISYNPRKPYCSVKIGKRIQCGLVFQKRSQIIVFEVLATDPKMKNEMEKFYNENKTNLSDIFDIEVDFKPEGDRNPDWCRIVANKEKDKNKPLKEYAEDVSERFIKFVEYLVEKWN